MLNDRAFQFVYSLLELDRLSPSSCGRRCAMPIPIPAESLLGRLQTVPDPRSSNQQYPLASILGALILGLLNGQTSGAGAWDWARQHWAHIWRPLGFHSPHCPVYSTVWNL